MLPEFLPAGKSGQGLMLATHFHISAKFRTQKCYNSTPTLCPHIANRDNFFTSNIKFHYFYMEFQVETCTQKNMTFALCVQFKHGLKYRIRIQNDEKRCRGKQTGRVSLCPAATRRSVLYRSSCEICLTVCLL